MFSLLLFTLAHAGENTAVKVLPDSLIYSNRDAVTETPWMWNRNKQQCYVAPPSAYRKDVEAERLAGTTKPASGTVRGTILSQSSGVAEVRLEALPYGCPNFNLTSRERTVVYVPSISLIDDDGMDEAEGQSQDVNTAVKCPGCRADGGKSKGPADIAAIMGKLNESGLANKKNAMKTDAELEQYIACHSTKNTKDYQRIYKRLFDIAGQTFNVKYKPGSARAFTALKHVDDMQNENKLPFLIQARAKALKCVALRESMWDSAATSQTGAMGLTQQVSTNMTEVNRLVKGDEDGGATPWASDLAGAYVQKVKAELRADPAGFKMITTNGKTGARCSDDLKPGNAYCPLNSVTAGALNNMNAEIITGRKSTLYKDSDLRDMNESEVFTRTVLTASVNNAGTGNLEKAVMKGKTPEDWLRYLPQVEPDPKRQKEIRDFIGYMKNCLEGGNFKSVWPLRPGEKPKDCTPFRREHVASGE